MFVGLLRLGIGLSEGFYLYRTAKRRKRRKYKYIHATSESARGLGVKRSGSKADHSHPSSAEVKECVELNLNSRTTSSWHGA
jgi:hypothetical protein